MERLVPAAEAADKPNLYWHLLPKTDEPCLADLSPERRPEEPAFRVKKPGSPSSYLLGDRFTRAQQHETEKERTY